MKTQESHAEGAEESGGSGGGDRITGWTGCPIKERGQARRQAARLPPSFVIGHSSFVIEAKPPPDTSNYIAACAVKELESWAE